MNAAKASCVLVAVAMGTACATPVGEEEGSSAQKLLIRVQLPGKLGGKTTFTEMSSHAKPTKTFAFGAKLSPRPASGGSGAVKMQTLAGTGTVNGAVDISAGAPEAGNQGQTGSCATWATGYSAMGWWAARSNLAGAPFAPMFLFAQQVKGSCGDGTAIADDLDILERQGIPSAAAYQPMEQTLDCAEYALDAATRASAAQHRISGYQDVDLSDPKGAIMRVLDGGVPVVLGIFAYNNFVNVTATSFLVGAPPAGEAPLGGHCVTAFAYDDKGVWILNSWGKDWGVGGWAELSWDFVESRGPVYQNVSEAKVITGLAGVTP